MPTPAPIARKATEKPINAIALLGSLLSLTVGTTTSDFSIFSGLPMLSDTVRSTHKVIFSLKVNRLTFSVY